MEALTALKEHLAIEKDDDKTGNKLYKQIPRFSNRLKMGC